MTPKPIVLEIASALVHEADSKELKRIEDRIEEEIDTFLQYR